MVLKTNLWGSEEGKDNNDLKQVLNVTRVWMMLMENRARFKSWKVSG